MRRVVLDTSVLVAGLRSRRGASFVLLRAVREGVIVPLCTPSLFLQYEDVVKRAEHIEATKLTVGDMDAVLGALVSLIEPVEVHILWRPQLRNPGDELVLEAAVNGRADALVTHNVVDFAEAAPRFGLLLLRPGEMLGHDAIRRLVS